MEKPGGLLHHQMLVPNLLGRSRPPGELNSTNNPGTNLHSPLDKLTQAQGKVENKTN
jgi:hypothetical protein